MFYEPEPSTFLLNSNIQTCNFFIEFEYFGKLKMDFKTRENVSKVFVLSLIDLHKKIIIKKNENWNFNLEPGSPGLDFFFIEFEYFCKSKIDFKALKHVSKVLVCFTSNRFT